MQMYQLVLPPDSRRNSRAHTDNQALMEESISAFLFLAMHFIYILYSREIDRYYIGETADLARRLMQHNDGYFEGAYTSRTSDWEIVLTIKFRDQNHALYIEKAIKKRKSRPYMENLIKYPALVEKLKAKF